VAARRGSAWVELAAKSHGRKCVRRPRTRARAASKDSRRGESGDLQVPREEDAGEASAGLGEEVPARKEQRERGLEPTLDVAMECFPSRAGPEREKRGDGVKEKGQCGLPFIEPRSGHVSQLQQVAGATVITLGDVFWQFLLRIGSWLLHKISSLIYTVQFLYRT
jgi:hypothetical protein